MILIYKKQMKYIRLKIHCTQNKMNFNLINLKKIQYLTPISNENVNRTNHHLHQSHSTNNLHDLEQSEVAFNETILKTQSFLSLLFFLREYLLFLYFQFYMSNFVSLLIY